MASYQTHKIKELVIGLTNSNITLYFKNISVFIIAINRMNGILDCKNIIP